MALLVGSRLASATLAVSAGSTSLLSEIYPSVPHITRFEVRPDRARAVLDSAESHLARISVPYAFAVHEEYVINVRDSLRSLGKPLLNNGQKWNAENMHEIIFRSMRFQMPSEMELFDLLRRLRNCMIHNGGLIDKYLAQGVAALTPDAERRWTRVVGRPPSELLSADRVSVGLGEIMVAFSVTRYLSDHLHKATLAAFPRRSWLKECVADFSAQSAQLVRDNRLIKRRLEGWAKRYYSAFNFSWTELHQEAIAQGLPSGLLRDRNSRRSGTILPNTN